MIKPKQHKHDVQVPNSGKTTVINCISHVAGKANAFQPNYKLSFPLHGFRNSHWYAHTILTT